jgi:hypothetical protein
MPALDHLGGYQSTNALVNTDWSQLSDAVALSVALPVARRFLHWSKPKKGSAAELVASVRGRQHASATRGFGWYGAVTFWLWEKDERNWVKGACRKGRRSFDEWVRPSQARPKRCGSCIKRRQRCVF